MDFLVHLGLNFHPGWFAEGIGGGVDWAGDNFFCHGHKRDYLSRASQRARGATKNQVATEKHINSLHRRQAQIVQLYSPDGAHMYPQRGSLGTCDSTPQVASWMIQPFLHSSQLWPTHRPRMLCTDICRNRTHLCTQCKQCGLNNHRWAFVFV